MNSFNPNEYPLQKETDIVLKMALEVHRNMGAGFLEIVYKDALEYEFLENEYVYRREVEYSVIYKGIVLPHKFYADFVAFNKVIVEVKAKEGGISGEDMAQTINYLRVSGCKVGLILNFCGPKLYIKRVVF